MHTPTIDHQEHPQRGACRCHPGKVCPRCMADLARWRHEQELLDWLKTWGTRQRPTPRARPLLRLVPGGG